MEGNVLSEVLAVVTALFNFIFTTAIPDVIETIVGNPFLLIGLGLMLIGASVSFVKRLIRVG